MKPASTFRAWLWVPVSILGIYALSIALSAALQYQEIEQQLELAARDELTRMLSHSAHRIEALLRREQPERVAEEIADLGIDLHVQSFVLTDDQGRVVEATQRAWRNQPAAGNVPRFDRAQFSLAQKGRRQVVTLSGSHLLAYQPVMLAPDPGELRSFRVGALMIDYDLSVNKSVVWHALLRQGFSSWSITLVLTLLLLAVLRTRVLRPLARLTESVRRFGAGEPVKDVHITGQGELATLADAWNAMHARLAATMAQLEDSHENLVVTLHSIGDAVIATDAQGQVTRMNAVAESLTGWTQAAAIGRPLAEVFNIIHARTRSPAEDPVAHVLMTGMIVGLANHTVLIARDGREFQIADSAAPIRSREGEVIGVVLVFRDVTEEYALRQAQEESELFARTVFDNEPECVKVLSPDSRLIRMNRAGLSMIEADTFEQVARRPMLDIIAPEYRDAFIQLNQRVFKGESGILEFEINGLKGGRRWLETHAVPMRDPSGQITALLGVTRDISERKQAEKALRIAEIAFEAQEGIMVTDANNVILRVNAAFSRITGYSSVEAVGQHPDLLQSGRHDDHFFAAMWESLRHDHYWQGEIWNRRKTGEIFPEWLTITAVLDDKGIVVNYVAAFSDITQDKAQEEQIHQLAFYDALTGLPNRRLLYDRLQQAIAVSTRTNCYGAILFIDLDNFKVINDTRGHDIGDMLLMEVASRLQGCVRSEDTVARIGGDEFVVMLDTLSESKTHSEQQVEIVGRKILQVFASAFNLLGRAHYTSPSIGITLFRGQDTNVEELLKHSDTAMYQAKQSGRNTLRFFDPEMQAVLESRMALEADIRRALPENEFKLYYQAQVDASGKLIGAEVLLRWAHPVRGLVPPGQFIPLAEETGLIAPLGQWTLEAACQQLSLWESDPLMRNLHLAVNVSARQFRQGTFVDEVSGVILMSGINPARLKLELTESLVLENVDDTIAKMRKLKAIGISFSMDDFGTGQSSLTYLKKLPLDQLKIDQSFVRDVADDPDDAIIVQTIIAMARNLKLDVIAEGVETEAQRNFLEQAGCLAYQGYFFGRPVPIEEFEAAVRA